MNIFHTQNIHDKIAILDESESHHCVKVLRLAAGAEVFVVNGKGGFFEGIISVSDHKACVIEIRKSQLEFGKRDFKIHIAIAPTKNIERFEWFLEKATEIGVDTITPILCKHSERKVLREDRLEKVIASAMKQSLKAYMPVFQHLIPFDSFIELPFTGAKLIAHCQEGTRSELIRSEHKITDFTILIGPEGDFSESEVKQAISKGFLPVSLGSSRLRTETAGIVACQIITDLMTLREK